MLDLRNKTFNPFCCIFNMRFGLLDNEYALDKFTAIAKLASVQACQMQISTALKFKKFISYH